MAAMDTSLGSDGEHSFSSVSCPSPSPATTRSTSDNVDKLKFSVAMILSPSFGVKKESPPMSPRRTPSAVESLLAAHQQLLASKVASNLGLAQLNAQLKCSMANMAACSPPLTSPAGSTSAQSTTSSSSPDKQPTDKPSGGKSGLFPPNPSAWPAWVYCTRYSDRPSSGPRCRRVKREKPKPKPVAAPSEDDEKRPRTAFTQAQLQRLKHEFDENKYLTEKRRQELAHELGLNESQIKIWFQNKRAKIKKQVGTRNPLALHLMSQGLYNHATIPIEVDEEQDQ